MSTSSLKMAVTAERPERETERSSTSFGMPFSAVSSGKVKPRSTSTGERPGASVNTATCTVDTSGTASIGSDRKAKPPAPISAMSITSMTHLRRIDVSTNDFNIQRKISDLSAKTPLMAMRSLRSMPRETSTRSPS